MIRGGFPSYEGSVLLKQSPNYIFFALLCASGTFSAFIINGFENVFKFHNFALLIIFVVVQSLFVHSEAVGIFPTFEKKIVTCKR